MYWERWGIAPYIYRFWTGGHIRTNINKTTITYVNNLNTRITQEIQSITKRTLYVVVLEIEKRIFFCISLGTGVYTFEQYL